MATTLPSRPSLDQLRHQAKDILRLHRAGDVTACETLRQLKKCAGLTDEKILAMKFALQEVQHALAQQYGFDSWVALCGFVESVAVQPAAGQPDYVAKLLQEAVDSGASDVHLDWVDGVLTPRLRVDGALRPALLTIPKEQQAGVIMKCKVVASLDPDNSRTPQRGRAQVRADGKRYDLRVASVPYVAGESVVVRILPEPGALPSLEQVVPDGSNLERLQGWLNRGHGMIVCTGPSGSGKSTTAYAMLKHLDTGTRKIISVEDPVEVRLPGVNQQQVEPAAGLTFATAIHSVLSQDPDVLLVAEVRDFETLRGALQVALTGHLVIILMHATDAASAVTRLIDLGIEAPLVADSLIGVIGQRLVRKVSTESPSEYRGRVPLQELLEVGPEVRDAIRAKASTAGIADAAVKGGMVALRKAGEALVAAGVTTEGELAGQNL